MACFTIKRDRYMLLPYMETGRIEAGCDEAGRGRLVGGGVCPRPGVSRGIFEDVV